MVVANDPEISRSDYVQDEITAAVEESKKFTRKNKWGLFSMM
jgi:hypothetical protein